MVQRLNARLHNQIRNIVIEYDVAGNALGSVLFCSGLTKVLCTVSIQDGVPKFLRKQGIGWLTAEYSLLPGSTEIRTARESSLANRNSRSVEISRLIGRTLRSVIDFSVLGERTITIDCDVIQADGGTRSAAINGAYCALVIAAKKLIESRCIKKIFLTDIVSAMSIGYCNSNLLLDIDCQEDNQVDADFNFILNGASDIIEIQGTSEKKPISWNIIQLMYPSVCDGIFKVRQEIKKSLFLRVPEFDFSTYCRDIV